MAAGTETDWPNFEPEDLQVILDLAYAAERIAPSVTISKYLADRLTDEMYFRRDLREKSVACRGRLGFPCDQPQTVDPVMMSG